LNILSLHPSNFELPLSLFVTIFTVKQIMENLEIERKRELFDSFFDANVFKLADSLFFFFQIELHLDAVLT
jgi:hypothetical protein